jgi:hypothetical protein
VKLDTVPAHGFASDLDAALMGAHHSIDHGETEPSGARARLRRGERIE